MASSFLSALSTIEGGVAIDKFIQTIDGMLNTVLTSSIYTTAMGVFLPVGISLCVVYFCIEVMDRTSQRSFTIDHLILQLIRFVIALALVSNLDSLIIGFGELVNAMNTDISAHLASLQGLNQYIKENNNIVNVASSSSNSTNDFLLNLNSILSFVFNACIQLGILVIGIERAIAIGAKGVLAPIIVPDVYHNGLNSSGIKFLKGLFADYFTSTMVIFVIEACSIVAFPNVNPDTSTQYMPGEKIITGIICIVILRGALKNTRQRAQQLVAGTLD